jgi:hypothetical protein
MASLRSAGSRLITGEMPQSLRSVGWLASLSLGGSRLRPAEMSQSLRSLRSLRLVRHLTGGAR